MRLVHRSDGAALDEFNYLAIIVGGMDLDAHLRCHLGLRRRLADAPRFPDVVRERLLTINVLAVPECEHCGKSVGVLARAHHHGVKVPGAVEELAEVGVFPGLRMLRGGRVQIPRVYVTERDDVFRSNLVQIARPAPARADDGDIQLVIKVLPSEQGGSRSYCHRRGDDRARELPPSLKLGLHSLSTHLTLLTQL